jgi:hypothetical protein
MESAEIKEPNVSEFLSKFELEDGFPIDEIKNKEASSKL